MKYKEYDKYKSKQIERAESKWGRHEPYESQFKAHLRDMWKQVSPTVGKPDTICCMGVRSGTELFEFRDYCPDAEIWGTDITENIKTIKNDDDKIHIVLQDFNNLPDNWENKFDLVFSNSLDHAFDPKETLKEWTRVTKPGGFIMLELSTHLETNIEHSFRGIELARFIGKQHEISKVTLYPDRQSLLALVEVHK